MIFLIEGPLRKKNVFGNRNRRWALNRCRKGGPRGGTQGAKPGSGVQRFWGPLGASEFDPSFQQIGVSETPFPGAPQSPGKAPRGPERLFRGLGEVCSFSTDREKKVGHSEAPKRSHFPGCPLKGFQPSGSYPEATDKMSEGRKHMGVLLANYLCIRLLLGVQKLGLETLKDSAPGSNAFKWA